MARVLGTEIEYGITSPGKPELSPILTSTKAVLAYAEAHADTEVGMFDTCCRVLKLSRAHGLTVYEYTKMSGHAGVSPAAVTAALLAYLN